MRRFRNVDEARRTFEEYADIEPRLRPLWGLCVRAAPPRRPANDLDDAFDVDAYDVDHVSGRPEDGWCAEEWFFQNIKPRFQLLVGLFRKEAEPPAMRGSVAYDDIYAALFWYALKPTCACCRERVPAQRRRA